jgi:hypothetical protein
VRGAASPFLAPAGQDTHTLAHTLALEAKEVRMTSLAISKERITELRLLDRRRKRTIAAAEDAQLELRKALEAAYEEGATYAELGKALGVVRQRAWQILNE